MPLGTEITRQDLVGGKAPERHALRILCCDDDTSFLDFIKTILGNEYNVTCLSNGAGVITHCQNEKVSLILLDYHMPPPNGLRVLSSLKHNSHTKDIPVIVVSCESEKSDIAKLVATGAEDFLLKPFPPELLQNKIHRILEKRAGKPSAETPTPGEAPKAVTNSIPAAAETSAAKSLYSPPALELAPTPLPPFSLEQAPQASLFQTIKLVSEMFFTSDSWNTGFATILEYALTYSKMQAGAIYARESARAPFTLVSNKNIREEDLNVALEEQINTISVEFTTENKNYLLFRSSKSRLIFLVYPLRTLQELLGLLFIKLPDEKWIKEIVNNQSLLYYLTVCNIHLYYLREQRIAKESMLELVKAFGASLDARAPHTQGHSDRVTMYAMAINAMAEKYAPNYYIPQTDLIMVAQLHDIGKIGMPDPLLADTLKPTSAELKTIKKHVEIGRRMLSKIPALRMAVDGTSHHERFDGLGYPDRLAGENIPLVGRILAVADTFDNLTTSRPSSRGLAPNIALKEINKGAGTLFDPLICDLFTKAYKEGLIRSALDFSTPKQQGVTEEETGNGPEAQTIVPENTAFSQEIISRLEDIAFGSPLTHELVIKLGSPQVKFAEMAKMIETRPMLSAKILRAANSAFYGFTRRIRTVEQAIVMLGLNATRHIIHIHNMLSLYKDLKLSNLDINRITQHSLVVGIIARHIAKRFNNRCLYEDAFLAGVMHDIGKMPLIKLYPEKYEKVVDGVIHKGKSFAQMELEVFGISHSEIGAHIWQKWSLPVFLGNAIHFMHDEKHVEARPDSLVNIVRCANDFSYRSSNPCVVQYPVLPFTHPLFAALGLNDEAMKQLLTDVENLLVENQDFIKLATM